MGDHQQGCLVSREVLFEPFGHVGIQVVGRLVEDQQVGFADQHRCQCHTFELSAGKLAYLFVEIVDL